MARDSKGKAPASAGADSPPAKAAEEVPVRTARVRAVSMGFYDNDRRRPGTVFDMRVRGDLPSWVVEVDGQAAVGAPVREREKDSPTTLSEIGQLIAPTGVTGVVI